MHRNLFSLCKTSAVLAYKTTDVGVARRQISSYIKTKFMRISNARFKEAHSSELFYIIKGILATTIRKKKQKVVLVFSIQATNIHQDIQH